MRAGWVLFIAVVLAAFAICILAFSDNSIYERNFGDYRVKIWVSSDDAGSDQQKIHGSYFQRGFVLMHGYASVDLPQEFETPSFTTVHDKTNRLICIYDNNNYGFLMIVNQANHDWYIGSMSGGIKISGPNKWQRLFETLKKANPEIPYGDYFESNSMELE